MDRKIWKKWLILACLCGFFAAAGLVVYRYYSFLFARIISGKVVAVSRVVSEVEGYVVAIRVPGAGVITARTDDPRWALVSTGQCAQAKFFPHPPWNLSDAGTYFRATLLLIRDCQPEENAAGDPPANSESPAGAGSSASGTDSAASGSEATQESLPAASDSAEMPGVPKPTEDNPK